MSAAGHAPSQAEQLALLRPVVRTGLAVLGMLGVLLAGPELSPTIRVIATTGFMLSVLAQSWNVLGGLAGYASFGQIVFFGIGGYGVALLMTRALLGFWLALPLAVLVAGASGMLLGPLLLRLRGQYFALATLVVAAAVSSAAVSFPGLSGGLPGLVITTVGTHRPTPYPGPAGFYTIFLVMAGLATAVVAWVRHSRFGLALRLMRENEQIAGEIGVPVTWVKVAAFGLSAMLAGAAGAVFGFQQVTVTPSAMFDSSLTVLSIAVVVLGGLGSTMGPLVCAIPLGVVSTLIDSRLPAAHTLVIGLLITAAALANPRRVLGRLRGGPGPAAGPAPGGDPADAGGHHLVTDPAPRLSAPGLEAPGPEAQGLDAGEPATGHISPWSRAGRTTAGPAALELTDLSVRFGGVHAVSGVTVQVRPGEVIGLLGPNGAGKSTLLDAIGGRLHPAGGQITIDARDVTGISPWRLARAGVARTHQVPRPLWGLTVEENIAAGLLFRCRSAAAARMRTERLLGWADLIDRRHDRPASLSIAELRRVDLARAAIARPRLILIDEPLAGADETESEVAAVIRMITDLREGGATVVLVEHMLAALLKLCDGVLVLHHGQPLAFGAPRTVLGQKPVISAYLGQWPGLRDLG